MGCVEDLGQCFRANQFVLHGPEMRIITANDGYGPPRTIVLIVMGRIEIWDYAIKTNRETTFFCKGFLSVGSADDGNLFKFGTSDLLIDMNLSARQDQLKR